MQKDKNRNKLANDLLQSTATLNSSEEIKTTLLLELEKQRTMYTRSNQENTDTLYKLNSDVVLYSQEVVKLNKKYDELYTQSISNDKKSKETILKLKKQINSLQTFQE